MNKKISFTPSPLVCARQMDIEVTDGLISKVRITGGCPGNSLGVSALVTGLTPEQAVAKLKGIRCGSKPTSCPDQLAIALESEILAKK